jgi:O-antigen/teichoic acid export membrane protein
MSNFILNKGLAWIRNIKERLACSPILYRFARGAFWSLLGTFVCRIFTFASTIIVARLLGKNGYGEMGMVLSTIGMFGVFAGFGLGATATKFIAEFHQKDIQKTGRIIVLTTIVGLIFSSFFALVCLLLSPWLSTKMLNRPDLVPLLMSGSLLLFMSAMNGVMSAALTGFEAFRKIAEINIWQAASVPFITIPLVWFFGVQGAIFSATIQAALGLLLCTLALYKNYIKDRIPINYSREIWREWPILWAFSLPSMISALMMAPATWITNSILVNQPNGYGELGLFTAANQWRNIVIIIPGLLSSAILPILSETHGNDDKTDFKKTVAFNIHLTWIVALPLTVLVVTFGYPLAALFGKQFQEAGPIISILMVACFLNIVNGAVGSALAGSGRMWTGTFMNLGWAIILVATAYFIIPIEGGKGLAYAYLAAYFVHTLWQMTYLELRIARFAVTSHWLLAIFTLLVLIYCLTMSFNIYDNYLYNFIIFVASLLPLLMYIRTPIRQYKLEKELKVDESCNPL